MNLEIY